MNLSRFLERRQDFLKALKKLQEAIAQPETDMNRDATIQRFEFTYELAWKTLKLYLESKDIDVRNAKDTLAESLQQGLITDPNWNQLHYYHNLTTHTYDEALALVIYRFLKQEGLSLFERLGETLKSLKV